MTEEFDADLFDAAEFGDLDWIKQHFEDPSLEKTVKRTQLEYQDKNGNSLLTISTYYKHMEIAFFLLSQKSQLEIKNKIRVTAEYKKVLKWITYHLKTKNQSFGSSDSIQLIHFYNLVFKQLWEMGWRGNDLTVEEQLPDQHMPDFFIKWRKELGK